MNKKKIVGYVRVSLEKQVDGYSLDGQIDEIKKTADYKGFEIKEIYKEEGRSGKSVEGRPEFKRMLNDIANSDDIGYVVVFKLSRFGRNVLDVLNSLEYIRRYGVELYTIEDGIDTSTASGKLLVPVLGAIAEIERENILAQTMLGRKQKAMSGGWNGGFAPYGYELINGKLEVVESRAEQVKKIFSLFLDEGMGYTTIARWLNSHDMKREWTKNSHNRKFNDWTCSMVKTILDNPLYTGRIAYGRRRTKKVKGTKNEYRLEKQSEYILSEEIVHMPLVSEEQFEAAKKKRKDTGKKGNPKIGRERCHLLSGILKCPDCGSSMFIDKNMWTNKDGTKRETFSYTCGHYKRSGKGGSCRRNGVPAEEVEKEVISYTKRLLNNPDFAEDIKQRIGQSVDLTEIEHEISTLKKQVAKVEKQVSNVEKDLYDIIEDDRHAERKRAALKKQLDKFYDEQDRLEEELEDMLERKVAASKEKLTIETIYKMLMCFDEIYDKLSDKEKRDLVQSMIQEINLYTQEERKSRDNYVKSIEYSFPVSDKVLTGLRDKEVHVETVVLLAKV